MSRKLCKHQITDILDSNKKIKSYVEEMEFDDFQIDELNWNNTQFDGKYPITLKCTRRVGQIMKYVGPDEKPQIRYAFYI